MREWKRVNIFTKCSARQNEDRERARERASKIEKENPHAEEKREKKKP